MYYPYSLRQKLLETHSWVELFGFVNALNSVKFTTFSVTASRDLARRLLTNLNFSVPFSRGVRFVENDYYCDLNHVTLMKLYNQLLQSWDFASRLDEKQLNPGTERFNSADDVRMSFVNSVEQILRLIEENPGKLAVHGIYNRETFEGYFGLVG